MKALKPLTILLAAGVGLTYFSLFCCSCSGNHPEKIGHRITNSIQTTLSSAMPYDVSVAATDTLLETQIRADFDRFSWESFIALNWSPDSSNTIGINGDNTTVWENWKENFEVFQLDGGKPGPWNAATQGKQKLLMQVGKTPAVLTAATQPFLTGPLIDQNGQYTRFEVVMNKIMFDYISNNTLYNYQGQQKFASTITFPAGSVPNKTHGAIMVKGSWKIMGSGDDTTRFHTAKAIIHVAAAVEKGIRDTTYMAQVGLVGLHIATKSNRSPQWIWSTFEQVDNAPTLNEVKDQHYNFYSKAAGDQDMNNAPAHPWDPNRAGQTPSQIVRLTPICSGTQVLNNEFHKKLLAINAKSVWQYYELVGTQWQVHVRQSPAGDPFPVYMANATLESYIQGIMKDHKVVDVPGATSSCIGCHKKAASLSGRTSDFIYLLRTASPLKQRNSSIKKKP